MKKSALAPVSAPETAPADRVSLLGMVLRTTIGFNPGERTAPRDLEADVRLALDLRAAGRSDDLADTIDYASLAERLRAVAAASLKMQFPSGRAVPRGWSKNTAGVSP